MLFAVAAESWPKTLRGHFIFEEPHSCEFHPFLKTYFTREHCSKYEVSHFSEESLMKWAECTTFTECLGDDSYLRGQSD